MPRPSIAALRLAAAAGAALAFAGCQASRSADDHPGSATFAPEAIGMEANEIGNPMRGQYLWLGAPSSPAGWPARDSYGRFNWDELESSEGVYHFEAIDAELAEARARGGRFGLRVMALCQGCPGHTYRGAGSSIPDYLADAANPLVGSAPGETEPYLIPDWNSAAYLDRLQALVEAIASRYRDDPHLAFVDVFSYGNWGEYHVYPFDQPGGPYDTSSQRPITDENARLLVRRAAAAFPGKLLVLNASNRAAVTEAVATAAPPVGLRVDCLGSDGLAGGGQVIDAVPGARDRWRTAPFITEWCQYNLGSSGADLFVQGEAQVRAYHVSMLSSGNFSAPPSTDAERAAFRAANVEAGYRLRVSLATVQLSRDGTVRLQSTWTNDGVAPTYLRWRAVLTLSGPVKAEVPLALDLRRVLPGEPLADDATVELGRELPPGDYQAGLRIDDVEAVSPPLALTMAGRQGDGSHLLGTVRLP